jgi:uncharacterized membrane protein (DUF2068 family)
LITKSRSRSPGITALSIFFMAGAAISLTAGLSLFLPGNLLESMWRLNPLARTHLSSLGPWAVVLLFAVSISCGLASAGLWRGARWGHRLAIVLIAINLIGDVANTLLGTEPRAIVGVPIALALLIYLLTKRVREFFTG